MSFLQGLPSILNSLILLGILALYFSIKKKPRTSTVFFVGFVVWFLLTSTHFLPRSLVKNLEGTYTQFEAQHVGESKDSVYILVLASGYSASNKLSATNQLDLNSLGRLVEGIRIKRIITPSVLVCSGYSAFKMESQASVTKRAAVELGVSADEILMLETTSSTREEATHFFNKFGVEKRVILVTDAIHMKRASFFFNRAGIQVIPAPTNFRIKEAVNGSNLRWIPSLENMRLMDVVLHEYLGYMKFYISSHNHASSE